MMFRFNIKGTCICHFSAIIGHDLTDHNGYAMAF